MKFLIVVGVLGLGVVALLPTGVVVAEWLIASFFDGLELVTHAALDFVEFLRSLRGSLGGVREWWEGVVRLYDSVTVPIDA